VSELEAELADLRRTVEEQDITIVAIGAAMLSLFDILAQVLETRGVGERSEIADRLQQIVDRERAKTDRAEREREALRTLPPDLRRPWRDLEGQKKQHALLEAFIVRITTPPEQPPSPPASALRVVRPSEEK
jgi:hypothetical protein